MEQSFFSAGQVIFREGDPADCAYLVEEGWVEILAELDQGNHPLSLIGPGEIFGEMGVIDGAPRSASAVATEDCRLLRVTRTQFRALLGQSEAFHSELLRKLVSRFRDTQRAFLSGDAPLRSETSRLGPGFAMLRRHRELADAIDQGEIVPFFQPIVDMATGEWRGFEALARWRSPTRGLLPPEAFLPLAERTGLVGRIDLAVAERALRICRTIPDAALPYLHLNFSAWHFRDESLVTSLARLLKETGVAAERIHIELTESLMLDDLGTALKVMTALRGLGLTLALDDFGTGFSSLSILHRMPIQVLKIDRGLLVESRGDGRPLTVLRHVLALARDLGLETVIEGVEDRNTARSLLAMGCRIGQGFVFGRPMPAEEAAAAWPDHHRAADAR